MDTQNGGCRTDLNCIQGRIIGSWVDQVGYSHHHTFTLFLGDTWSPTLVQHWICNHWAIGWSKFNLVARSTTSRYVILSLGPASPSLYIHRIVRKAGISDGVVWYQLSVRRNACVKVHQLQISHGCSLFSSRARVSSFWRNSRYYLKVESN